MPSGWGLSWGGWLDNRRGEWWLLGQVLLISAHLLPTWPAITTLGLQGWPLSLVLLGALVLTIGVVLAYTAFLALGSNLCPLPEPGQGNTLVTAGPYSRCRHPMYQAVLICSLGVVIALGSLLHLLLLLCLALLLRGKAKREERPLLALHPQYCLYQREVPAIIPNCPGLDWPRQRSSPDS